MSRDSKSVDVGSDRWYCNRCWSCNSAGGRRYIVERTAATTWPERQALWQHWSGVIAALELSDTTLRNDAIITQARGCRAVNGNQWHWSLNVMSHWKEVTSIKQYTIVQHSLHRRCYWNIMTLRQLIDGIQLKMKMITDMITFLSKRYVPAPVASILRWMIWRLHRLYQRFFGDDCVDSKWIIERWHMIS
jgi:hypothetical protein